MLRDRSGMALVLTLLAVSFLVAVTVQLGTSVNRQLQVADNQAKTVRLDAMLLSGLNLARAALLADQLTNTFDTTLDDWGEFDAETLAVFAAGGSMEITVTDLSGLLQVNALVLTDEEKRKRQAGQKKEGQEDDAGSRGDARETDNNPEKVQRELWQRFLLSGNVALDEDNEDVVAELLDSLADWLDADDEERDNGAERGYYSSLNPPYAPANRALLYPEELLLVRGWNEKLLYGEKERSGIIDYLTIGGQDGKININTAPPMVLQALHPEMTEELAADLIDFRSEEANREQLEQPEWYRRVSGFPGDITFDKELVTTSSSYFRITVTASIDRLQRTGQGVILRQENNEQVMLYWKVE